MTWALSPGASQTFPVGLGSTESPAIQLVCKAPVLAAMSQGWNLLPISTLSVGRLRGLCHNPFPPSRRKAPLPPYSSLMFSGLRAPGSYLLTCETQSLTHPYHRKVGPSRGVGGDTISRGRRFSLNLE